MKSIQDIPLGAKVRTTRRDGSSEVGVFVGFDECGLIFEDDSGKRCSDVGPWVEVAVNTGGGWTVRPQ